MAEGVAKPSEDELITRLEELSNDEQAVYILSHYPRVQATEKFVLLMAALYTGFTLSQLAELCTTTLPTVRNHLRWWQVQGAVRLEGSGKNSAVVFLGVRAWMTHDRPGALKVKPVGSDG